MYTLLVDTNELNIFLFHSKTIIGDKSWPQI